MTTNAPQASAAAPEPERGRSHLFTVRLWAEPVGEGSEHRGSVRHVASGAFRSFREWADLTAFLAARIDEEHDRPHSDR